MKVLAELSLVKNLEETECPCLPDSRANYFPWLIVPLSKPAT